MKQLWRHIMFNYVRGIRHVSHMIQQVSVLSVFNTAYCLGYGGIEQLSKRFAD